MLNNGLVTIIHEATKKIPCYLRILGSNMSPCYKINWHIFLNKASQINQQQIDTYTPWFIQYFFSKIPSNSRGKSRQMSNDPTRKFFHRNNSTFTLSELWRLQIQLSTQIYIGIHQNVSWLYWAQQLLVTLSL